MSGRERLSPFGQRRDFRLQKESYSVQMTGTPISVRQDENAIEAIRQIAETGDWYGFGEVIEPFVRLGGLDPHRPPLTQDAKEEFDRADGLLYGMFGKSAKEVVHAWRGAGHIRASQGSQNPQA